MAAKQMKFDVDARAEIGHRGRAGVAEIAAEIHIVGVKVQPGGVELTADGGELIERHGQAPLPQLFAAFDLLFVGQRPRAGSSQPERRFHVTRVEFGYPEADIGDGFDRVLERQRR